MKKVYLIIVTAIFVHVTNSCNNELVKTTSVLSDIEITNYHEKEIFPSEYINVYGKWKLIEITGGLHGLGYENNFEYLEIKPYGIYAIVRKANALEFGKIVRSQHNEDEDRFLVNFENDKQSERFIGDSEKYIELPDKDNLILQAPCCDRFSFHFKRVN